MLSCDVMWITCAVSRRFFSSFLKRFMAASMISFVRSAFTISKFKSTCSILCSVLPSSFLSTKCSLAIPTSSCSTLSLSFFLHSASCFFKLKTDVIMLTKKFCLKICFKICFETCLKICFEKSRNFSRSFYNLRQAHAKGGAACHIRLFSIVSTPCWLLILS